MNLVLLDMLKTVGSINSMLLNKNFSFKVKNFKKFTFLQIVSSKAQHFEIDNHF